MNPISVYPRVTTPIIFFDNQHLLYTLTDNHHGKYQSEKSQRCSWKTRQRWREAGKRPTADSPALRFSQYDKGHPNDPPDTLAGTSRGTKVKRRANWKSPPELSGPNPVNQETNVDPPAILDCQEVTVQPPPIVLADRQEARAQQPSIVPDPPKIDEPEDPQFPGGR